MVAKFFENRDFAFKPGFLWSKTFITLIEHGIYALGSVPMIIYRFRERGSGDYGIAAPTEIAVAKKIEIRYLR
jgi:hypothetical protein